MRKKLTWLVTMVFVLNLCLSGMAVFAADATTTDLKAEPSGDVLKLTATVLKDGYYIWNISKEAYTFAAGDYIEYDVYISDKVAGLGSIEIYCGNPQFRSSTGPWEDQNGLSGKLETDISAKAYKQWYHRKLAIPADRVGLTTSDFDLATQTSGVANGTVFTVYYDNYVVTNGGKVVKEIYKDGAPSNSSRKVPESNVNASFVLENVLASIVPAADITTPEVSPSVAPTATPEPTVAPTATPEPTVAPTATPAPATPAPKTVITLVVAAKNMSVDKGGVKTTVAVDAPAFIYESRTYMPIRQVVEALGGTLSWDAKTQTVSITRGTENVSLTVGKPIGKVNGVDTQIDKTSADVWPFIVPPGRTVSPVRFVCESLGATLGWDQATRTITVTYQP